MALSEMCTSDLFNPACFLGIPGLLWVSLGVTVLFSAFLVFWWFKSTGSEDIPVPISFLVAFVFTIWFMAASLNGLKTQPDDTTQRYVVGASAILVITGVGVSRLLVSVCVAVYKFVLNRRKTP